MIRSSNPTVLSDRLRQSIETQEHPRTALREYGVGAQILLDLGVHEMILLSSTVRSIVGLEAYGLTIVEQRPITIPKDYVLPVRDKFYG
jgi:3,4-dihydroxy 2-butanone 4-phosphate synthase/GTP cyclohydrolase II